jgi:hypothetical protein
MDSAKFINIVKQKYKFLIDDFGFSFGSAEVSNRFSKPIVIYNRKHLYIKIAEGRGSVKVFIRILDEIDLGFTFGEIVFFLDNEHLPHARISGYGPDVDWDQELESKLLQELDWYAHFVQKQIPRVLELINNKKEATRLNSLVSRKRDILRELNEQNPNSES